MGHLLYSRNVACCSLNSYYFRHCFQVFQEQQIVQPPSPPPHLDSNDVLVRRSQKTTHAHRFGGCNCPPHSCASRPLSVGKMQQMWVRNCSYFVQDPAGGIRSGRLLRPTANFGTTTEEKELSIIGRNLDV